MHHAKRITTLPSFLLTLQLLLALCFPLLTRSSHLTMFVFQPSLLSAFLLLQADSLFFLSQRQQQQQQQQPVNGCLMESDIFTEP